MQNADGHDVVVHEQGGEARFDLEQAIGGGEGPGKCPIGLCDQTWRQPLPGVVQEIPEPPMTASYDPPATWAGHCGEVSMTE
jgi:hypothetical protein